MPAWKAQCREGRSPQGVSRLAQRDRFIPDRRANRLEASKLEQSGSNWLLKYRGSPETSLHIVGALPRAKVMPSWPNDVDLPHRIRFDFTPPADLKDFLQLLQEVLVIEMKVKPPRLLDAAIALDFYQDRIGPDELRCTPAGELVRKAKGYGGTSSAASREAGMELCDRLCEVVVRHQWLINSTRIVPVPGHRPDVWATSQRMGVQLSRDLGIPLVEVVPKSGRRTPAKNMTRFEREALRNEFTIKEDLDGQTVLIVDDFYETGHTMAGLASAAKRAGAKTALGLAGVRNMTP
ncbi:ComF family protein [Lentzea sp. NPDC004789]